MLVSIKSSNWVSNPPCGLQYQIKVRSFGVRLGFSRRIPLKGTRGEEAELPRLSGGLFSSRDESNIERVCEEEKTGVKMGLVEGVRAAMTMRGGAPSREQGPRGERRGCALWMRRTLSRGYIRNFSLFLCPLTAVAISMGP